MKLVSFSVQDYRSITKAYKIEVRDSVVLIGPNNEGKSNILRALVAAMQLLTSRVIAGLNIEGNRISRAYFPRKAYDWKRDYPIHLQKSKPNGNSILILEFELNSDEILAFRSEVGSNLNGTLPLKLAFGPRGYEILVYKKGPGAKALSGKVGKISSFVSKRIDFEYIPAVRTATSAQQVVEEMVARELEAAESEPSFRAALASIVQIQRPILDRVAENIRSTLVQFLPAVKKVGVTIPEEERYRALRRRCVIEVDDGTPTELNLKGDGMQSLAALGIMRHASESGSRGKKLIVAIEEPESHLHPRAIHELSLVLQDLSRNHQVIITTHCPLLVNRNQISANVVVHEKRARSAKRIEEIRDVLGVKASDNLRHAELVLVVEGDEDRIGLTALLPVHSAELRTALQQGVIAIESLGGGANLSYKVSLIRDCLCNYHCFVDDDQEGRSAVKRAEKEGLLTSAQCTVASCPGLIEAEMEDLYDQAVYEGILSKEYNVDLGKVKGRGKKKWSTWMARVFKAQGQIWDEDVRKKLKLKIAITVAGNPGSALDIHRRSAFDALVTVLAERVTSSVSNADLSHKVEN